MPKKYYQLLFLLLAAVLMATGVLIFLNSSNQKNILAYDNQNKIISQNIGVAEHPDIAVNNNGDSVIVWQEKAKDWDIYAQRINKDGEKVGNIFKVNQYSVSDQKFPKTAMDKDGNFVIVWQSYFQNGVRSEIYGQKFKANGQKWGSEFRINYFLLNNQMLPDVAMNDEGIFVVIWVSEDQDGSPKSIYARIFNPDGMPMTKEIKVNLSKTGIQTNPVVAINSNNQIIIVWQSSNEDDWDIYAQILNLNGEKSLQNDLLVNTETSLDQIEPNVTANDSNNFIVVWSNQKLHPVLEIVMENIEGKVLNGTGVSLKQTFDINSPEFGHHNKPYIYSKDGHSVVAWQNFDKNDWEILMQYLDNKNNLLGVSFKLYEEDQLEQLDQKMPVIAMYGQSSYHIVWTNVDIANKQKKILYKQF